MRPVYLYDWKDSKLQGMLDDFQIKKEDIEGCNILFASYTNENYSGNAFVLFEKDQNLYEVNGSHCSCYGLETYWEPELTTVEAIEDRITKGYLGSNAYEGESFDKELLSVLKKIKKAKKNDPI